MYTQAAYKLTNPIMKSTVNKFTLKTKRPFVSAL